ncbi:hypothetical protein N7466_008480 [Penicillium verhagenii]|uniref:uncharacterized protein n=1 Tax=Penicillium verhagenii TaxID=1562060 RepID=UPI0025451D5B|nr:uncharacterized protein N7466_008480 [Penicillium verhagenii]KAJ5924293.1 hypothetical protein N7466_008480 [Penicillium verhagenii]
MTNSKLHTIGQGACGTVWAESENGPIYKREDGGPGRSLGNDFEMHHRIIQSFLKFNDFHKTELQVEIPTPYNFIKANDQDWWSANLQMFPSGYTPCNMIHAQRIPPFPQAARENLISRYCPSNIQSTIINSEPDKDCVVRLYLGRRRRQRSQTSSRFTAFSLRNFPLHLDQVESLGTSQSEIHKYAEIMAETLAVMHWIAEVDGNDIEFVLALPNNGHSGSGVCGLETDSHPLGRHSMWVLDFDLCRATTVDLKGVEQSASAFWRNDHYYPRPDLDRELWTAFREHYVLFSDACAETFDHQEGQKRRDLARHFIDLLEQGVIRVE